MLQKIYINNFRCFENFELKLEDFSSALLIGKNGAGKTTFAHVLEIFQKIGRGFNRVGQLVNAKDFAQGRSGIPIRFELEVLLDRKKYKYSLSLGSLPNFDELRIEEEQLFVDEKLIFSRKQEKAVYYVNGLTAVQESFSLDWHLVALPAIHQRSGSEISIFKEWLASIIILAPIPSLMNGNASGETLEPIRNGSNFGDWISGLLSRSPAAFATINDYLKGVMPDIEDFISEKTGKNSKTTNVRFLANNARLNVEFNDLSDGEKCFFLCAVVIAANKSYGPLFCFWDEPDNYLSIAEVGFFITALRRSFQNGAQILMTSHNSEAIQKFSDQNTIIFDRKSHLEPTLVRRLSDENVKGGLINALIRGDLSS